jgi:hypothetical protein
MSVTLNTIAYQALRDLGCLRPGQTTSADVLSDILYQANQLIDAWLIDRFLVYTIAINAYTLTAGTQIYTIGPTVSAPNIVAPRPTRIEYANIILNTVSPPVRQSVEILRDDKQWGRIRVQQIPFAIPLKLYYDMGFSTTDGHGTIYLWPGPQSSYQLELFTWQQLQSFPSGTTPLIFPPGYQRLIQKNLAVEIAPMMRMYAKVPGPGGLRSYDPAMLAKVEMQAREAKHDLEQYNAPEDAVLVDLAYSGGSRKASFNYGTGDIGSPR